MTPAWMRLADESAVPSPALLVFPDRIEENLRRMISLAGGAERLRPHLKTHKLPQLIALQASLGITRCKAATIAEAEMAAGAGATGGAVAYWGVADAPKAFERLIALGAAARTPVQEVGGGIRLATVTDPFGNVLGLIENPHFTLG